jgi:MSHA pilin protein MshB
MKQKSMPTKFGQQGFTFIELIIVIILLGLLAAAALPRYLDVTDDAEIASLEGVAGGFSTAVAIAHAQWYAEGGKRGTQTSPRQKSEINLDGKIIYLNENGWPANTRAEDDSSEDNQTAQECLDIWVALLQSAPPATIDRQSRANARYFINSLAQAGGDDNLGTRGDLCRYELILNNDAAANATHYFDYDLTNGQVSVTKPNQ